MKKVSVGEPKGAAPQKSRKKGFIILIVVAVVLIALFLIGNTGCSNKSTTDTTTPKATPVPITTRVSGLESRVDYLEQHPVVPTAPFDPSGLQALIDAITTRVGTLETTVATINLSTLQAQVVELAGTISFLNLSLYSHLLTAPVPTPTTVPGTTPTPTTTGNHAPTVYDISYDNFSESYYYAILTCNASDVDNDALVYNWFAINTSSFVNNGQSKIYWIPPSGWNVSIPLSISVIVLDGKGGNVSFTRLVTH
jgi:outer membrane murein-binding lipoprotein Lpp